MNDVLSQVSTTDDELNAFFANTSTTQQACDARAKELTGTEVKPVEIQGISSYSVYAGQDLVIQFRLKAVELKPSMTALAKKIYGGLAPTTTFQGLLGVEIAGIPPNEDEQPPLAVYSMDRIHGVGCALFFAASPYPPNELRRHEFRETLIRDLARFHAMSWNEPQRVDLEYRHALILAYVRDLERLIVALPPRFEHIIRRCIESIDQVFALPLVLSHVDLGMYNMIVDPSTCHLRGVIDWAESQIQPFGINLYHLESITGDFNFNLGWTRFDDLDTVQEVFWSTFRAEAKGYHKGFDSAIMFSRTIGILLYEGYSDRVGTGKMPTPIGDDEAGRRKLLSLDDFLINPSTKIDGP